MPTFKPAYLIHGDDHGRIAERRARLRSVAEAESGTNGVELFEGDGSDPEAVAAALNAMTFAIGRRFLVVDGVERWKDKELDTLVAALSEVPPDTTVSFFAREDGRFKAPKRLVDAVRGAGGDVAAEQSVKPWELPKWVVAQGRQLGLSVSTDAARALIAHVGERQQRLARELEKLALYGLESIDVEAVDALTASSSERKVWTLGDALVGGDLNAVVRVFLELRSQGERTGGLLYGLSNRLRDAHRVAAALDAGDSQANVKRTLRMPPRAADQLIADARRMGTERLCRAVELVAELEAATRGGADGGAHEDTRMLLALREIAG